MHRRSTTDPRKGGSAAASAVVAGLVGRGHLDRVQMLVQENKELKVQAETQAERTSRMQAELLQLRQQVNE
jgi:hypothetical protein